MSEFELSVREKSNAMCRVMAMLQKEVGEYPVARGNNSVNAIMNYIAVRKVRAVIEHMLKIINEFPTEPTMTSLSVDELLSGDELLSEEEEEEE